MELYNFFTEVVTDKDKTEKMKEAYLELNKRSMKLSKY